MAEIGLRSQMKRNIWLAMMVAIVLGFGMVGLARAQDDEGPASSVRFVVVRDSDGKPVRNAAVVLHPVKRKGKQAQEEIELKTDADGRASVDGIPYGPLRVQVLAPHFQTFGEDYKIDKPALEITVKLKHPSGQYSIYENHDEQKADDKKPQ
jgi:Carboxypeptidase regulatory-like domain